MVDLSVGPAGRDGCDGPASIPSAGPSSQQGGCTRRAHCLTGEGRARYFLLDAGQGIVLLIDVEAPDQPTWDAAIADATPIIESFEFAR